MTDSSYVYLNTHDMEWRDYPDIPGFKEKMLYRDEERQSDVRLWYVPPGFGDDILHGEPHRHYHKSVIERSYVLFGDFPHWEFSTVDDLEGELVMFRPGLVMDRPVGSLHGLLPEPKSQTGSVLLYWNSGPGTSVNEPTYENESIDVPFDPHAKVEINQFNQARLFMAGDVPWQSHPVVPAWKYKPLAEAVQGSGAVSMVHIPTEWTPDVTLGEASEPSWLFVLSGDLRLRRLRDGQILSLVEGSYLRWKDSKEIAFADGAVTDIGCTALCVGAALVGP